ncbi:MAG TPA: Crp/Fnr family transcriptional regulator [Ferruginibacter sp.]|nr:Crp/Fnr family transcriptional regulator [Ferruginibacter sp.]
MINIDTLLAWGAVYKKLDAGEFIFREGTACNFYYQLVEGSVKWFNVTEDGKEFLQQIIEPGECFGELPLFDDEPYAANAMANKEALVLRLSRHTFHQLLIENPPIHFAFSNLLAQRVRFKFYLLKELAYSDPEQKITSLLQYLDEHQKNICPKCHQLKLTRQQIADMTGLRVETVIRAMRNLHDKGVVNIRGGKVFLGNMREIIAELD